MYEQQNGDLIAFNNDGKVKGTFRWENALYECMFFSHKNDLIFHFRVNGVESTRSKGTIKANAGWLVNNKRPKWQSYISLEGEKVKVAIWVRYDRYGHSFLSGHLEVEQVRGHGLGEQYEWAKDDYAEIRRNAYEADKELVEFSTEVLNDGLEKEQTYSTEYLARQSKMQDKASWEAYLGECAEQYSG